jgi:NADPH2:quinone reductase
MVVLGKAMGQPLRLEPEQVDAFFYTPALNQSLLAFNLGLYFGFRAPQAFAALQQLIGCVASGQVKVPVGRVLPLGEAAQAHRLLEDRVSTGKIILKPWG